MDKSEYCAMTPYFGSVDFQHSRRMIALKDAGTQLVHQPGCPYIDMVRGSLLKVALDNFPRCKVFIFIDHDIIFEPETVEGLAEKLSNSEYDVLGVPYPTRQPHGKVIGFVESDSWTAYIDKEYPANFLGMGMTAIKLRVINRLLEIYPPVNCPSTMSEISPMFQTMITDEGWLGEDVAFCRRAQKHGYKVGIWAKPRIYHRGQYDYALEDVPFFVANNETLTFNKAK